MLSYIRFVPLCLMIIYFLKLIFILPTFTEASIFAILVLVVLGFEYETKKSRLVELEKKIKDMHEGLTEQKKFIDQSKNEIYKLKVTSGVKENGPVKIF